MKISGDDIEKLEAVKKIIEKDLGVRYTIAELVRLAGMSPTKLTESFKTHYGMNLFAYVRAKRMNLAYELVCNTGYQFKKIAKLTGYKHLAHFNTAFKKRFTVSASKLRKEGKGRRRRG